MARLRDIPRNVYPQGTYTLNSAVVPQGATQVSLIVNRFAWPDTGGDVLAAEIEFSLDAGQTWAAQIPGEITAARFTAAGGESTFKGQPFTFSGIILGLPGDPQDNQRRVRATVTIIPAGGLDLSASIEVI